jgi:hypothetical protein
MTSLSRQASWAKMTSLGGKLTVLGVQHDQMCKQRSAINLSLYKHYILSMFLQLRVRIQIPRTPYWRRRPSKVELLVLTRLDQPFDIANIIYYCKTSCLNEEVIQTEPSPSVSVRCKYPKKCSLLINSHPLQQASKSAVYDKLSSVCICYIVNPPNYKTKSLGF